MGKIDSQLRGQPGHTRCPTQAPSLSLELSMRALVTKKVTQQNTKWSLIALSCNFDAVQDI